MPSEFFRQDRWLLPGLLLLSLFLRLTVLERYARQLDRDLDLYRRMATAIRDGRGFIHPDTGLPTAYRPPLYPVVLSLVLRGGGGETAIGVLHLFLSVATIALTFAAARRLRLGEASWVASGLVAVDPLLLYNVSQVMTETLATFLSAATVWWLTGPAPPPDGVVRQRSSILWAFGLGALFGLCGLCRPTFFAWGALLAAGWCTAQLIGWLRKMLGKSGASGNLWSAVTVVAGFTIAVSPWVLRNVSEFGRPILSTTHGGYTLLLGHNPVYYEQVVRKPWGTVWEGNSLRKWQQSLEQAMAAESPLIRRDEVARDRWMWQRAQEYMLSDPKLALRSGLTLVGRMWNIAPLDPTNSSGWPLILLMSTFYAIWFAAMLVGLYRMRREEWSAWWPGLALIVSFTGVHFFYWADLRMRAPLIPVMALLAARAFRKGTATGDSRPDAESADAPDKIPPVPVSPTQ
jgi:hypothetical protein